MSIKSKVKNIYKELVEKALFSSGKRDIILFADHFIEPSAVPQDNFYMFEYMAERNPEGLRPHYIMNEGCSMYPAAKAKYGSRIIGYGKDSLFKLKIFGYLRKTKIVCDSYQVMNHVVPGFTAAAKNSPYIFTIFTQHGITFFKEDFIELKSYSSFMFDRVVVSNDYEKDIFLGRGMFREENIIKNGLCRWDFIKPEYNSKSIFLFFTHRRYLSALGNITDSEYYKAITRLVEALKQNSAVKEGGYKIKIALHHSVLDKFGYDLLKGIETVKEEDIEQVKSQADILITDYSSMCFEMWYQHKPVIFLHIHDEEDCRAYGNVTDLAEPYKKTGRYICNISDSIEECIGIFENYAKSGFRFTKREEEIRDFFFYCDGGFRERFYNYLCKLSGEEKHCFLPIGREIFLKDYSDIFTKKLDFPDEKGRCTIGKKASLSFSLSGAGKNASLRLKCCRCGETGGFNAAFSVGSDIKRTRFADNAQKEIIFKIPKSCDKVRIDIKTENKIRLISITLIN